MRLKSVYSAAATLMVGGLMLGNALLAHAAPALDTGAEIKSAALALVKAQEPGFVVDHVDIDRVVNNYATALVYPNMQVNPTDPGIVILRNDSGTWQGIGGPGTDFPDQASRAGAPDSLFDYVNPYTGANAQAALDRLTSGRLTYRTLGLQFQYPTNATVEQGDTNKVLGPEINAPISTGGTFQGRPYEIEVNKVAAQLNGQLLDEWGYNQMLAELKQRQDAAGPGARVAAPLGATYFHIDTADVFLIDWLAGDGIDREFYVTAPSDGQILRMQTHEYQIEANPAHLDAESAVNLVLHTLAPYNSGIVGPGMPSTGGGMEDPLLAIFGVAGAGALVLGLLMRQFRKRAI